MDKIQTIKTETDELLKKMIEKFETEVQDDDGIFHILIKAEEEAPTVIGRHGETIRAIQKILEVVLYKKLMIFLISQAMTPAIFILPILATA